MLLKGFGFSGYRSFGEGLTKIVPLRKINLVIGQNNVGKSNIVNFLHKHYEHFASRITNQRRAGRRESSFQDIDKHISAEPLEHKIAFPILREDVQDYISSKLSGKGQRSEDAAKKLLSSTSFCDEAGDIWFVYKSSDPNGQFHLDYSREKVRSVLTDWEWQVLWTALTGSGGGGVERYWMPESISALAFVPSSFPVIEVIPAIRKIGAAGTEASDFSGEGIIERLAKIQNPSHAEQGLKEKFLAINMFVKSVMENNSAEIEIPYERNVIQIHMDGKTLPLDSLGTGVHEVVILAAAATLLEETIICVEEPELHLHPLLQRKLIKYLYEKTNNQYFFTTHSAHLLDAVVDAEIFHVTQVGGVSVVDAIASTKKRSSVCSDLGYKASDILQANCVVWVEGPSDRIYLNYWLASKRPDFVEGVHYSIMFYGGRLFSHLTALDNDEMEERVEDFISVRNLNRNTAIIFDSDKNGPRARISETKRRLKAEFNSGQGFAWVTKGREIENYLEYDKLELSVLAVHPSAERLVSKGEWVNLLEYEKVLGKRRSGASANKVKVARHYVSNHPANLSVLDLSERIEQLCDFIVRSNGNEI